MSSNDQYALNIQKLVDSGHDDDQSDGIVERLCFSRSIQDKDVSYKLYRPKAWVDLTRQVVDKSKTGATATWTEYTHLCVGDDRWFCSPLERTAAQEACTVLVLESLVKDRWELLVSLYCSDTKPHAAIRFIVLPLDGSTQDDVKQGVAEFLGRLGNDNFLEAKYFKDAPGKAHAPGRITRVVVDNALSTDDWNALCAAAEKTVTAECTPKKNQRASKRTRAAVDVEVVDVEHEDGEDTDEDSQGCEYDMTQQTPKRPKTSKKAPAASTRSSRAAKPASKQLRKDQENKKLLAKLNKDLQAVRKDLAATTAKLTASKKANSKFKAQLAVLDARVKELELERAQEVEPAPQQRQRAAPTGDSAELLKLLLLQQLQARPKGTQMRHQLSLHSSSISSRSSCSRRGRRI